MQLRDIFEYVDPPQNIYLGRDEIRIDKFACNPPVLKTLKDMLQSDFCQGLMSEDSSDARPYQILFDRHDGGCKRSSEPIGFWLCAS